MKEKLMQLCGLTEESAQKVVDNLGKVVDGEYVPKSRLNEVISERDAANQTIKDRDEAIEDLGKDAKDLEDIKKERDNLLASNKVKDKEKEDALAAERKTNAIKLELIGKVHNPDIAMTLLKSDDVVMDKDNKIKSGLKEQIESLKKEHNYLFLPEDKPNNNQNINPFVKGATPKEGDSAKQTDLSPAETLAKELAVNANKNAKKSAESIYFGEQ